MKTYKDGLEECLEIVKSLDIKELEFAMWLSGHDRDTIEQLYKDFCGGIKPQVIPIENFNKIWERDENWIYKKYLDLAKSMLGDVEIEKIQFSAWLNDHIQVLWKKKGKRFCSQIGIPKG